MSQLFYGDFEDGTGSFWSTSFGAVTTTTVYAGVYSWEVANARPIKTLTAISEFWMSWAFRFNLLPSSGTLSLLDFRNGASIIDSIRINTAGKLVLNRGSSTLLATGTTVLSVSTWYLVKTHLLVNSSSGVFEAKLGTVSEVSFSGNTGSLAIDTLPFGSTSRTYQFDNIAADDAGYPGEGGTLAFVRGAGAIII